nr:hypothetical protein [Tanacetum cinerariifolium]
MQMVGGNGENQFIQYAGQNVGNLNRYNAVQNVGNQVAQNPRVQNVGNQNGLIGVPGNGNQNGNGNFGAAHAEENAARHNGNQIRCYNCRGVGHFARNYTVRPRKRDAAYLQTQLLIAQKEETGIQHQAKEFNLMAATADLDEIKKVNANCILMANLQQASTSGTQTDKAPVYDSDGSAEFIGTVRFRNDHVAVILGFGDLQALCFPKNDHEDIGKLGAKCDIGFFIGYSADSCAIRIYNRRTKKIITTMNVLFNELSAMAFEQRSELDLLFEAMYDDYIGGQLSATARTVTATQEPQVRQASTASTSIEDTAPTPTNTSSTATNIPITSQDVDELNPNVMDDGNTFVNPSTSTAESSSSKNVDPSNMHTFYQPYPQKFQWTKDHPLEQVIGEPSRPILTRNQLRSDGNMCMYALT